MNKNKEYLIRTMKGLSDHMQNLFNELDHESDPTGMVCDYPFIFFKEEKEEVYKCFSLRCFEIFEISFKMEDDKEILVIKHDEENELTAAIMHTDEVFSEIFPSTHVNQLYYAMIEIVQFFKHSCKCLWQHDRAMAKFIKSSRYGASI